MKNHLPLLYNQTINSDVKIKKVGVFHGSDCTLEEIPHSSHARSTCPLFEQRYSLLGCFHFLVLYFTLLLLFCLSFWVYVSLKHYVQWWPLWIKDNSSSSLQLRYSPLTLWHLPQNFHKIFPLYMFSKKNTVFSTPQPLEDHFLYHHQ